MASFVICERLRFWDFLRPRCSWYSWGKVVDLSLRRRRMYSPRRNPKVLPRVEALPEGEAPAGLDLGILALGEAISSLMRAVVVDAREMKRAPGAYARMASVARRISRAETFVAMPGKYARSSNVSYQGRPAQIRKNAELPHIANIRWVSRASVEIRQARDVWVECNCRRASVYQGRRRALRECLRRNPMNRSRVSKLVSSNPPPHSRRS
jgi:hypothetical protein